MTKSLKVMTQLFLLISIGLLLVGCKGSDVDLDQLVKDAVVNSMDVKQQLASIDATVDFDIEDERGNSKGDIDLIIDGYFAETDDFKPLFDMNIKGEFALEEEAEAISGSFEADVKMDNDELYLNLVKVPERALGEEAGAMVAGFVGKWWKFALPAEAITELTTNVTPEQEEEIRTVLSETFFFDELKDLGVESVNGQQARHISAKFSKAGLLDYVTRISELADAPISEQQRDDVESVLSVLTDTDVEMWITEKDGHFTKMNFDFEISLEDLAKEFNVAAEEDVPEGEISIALEVNTSDFNVIKDIELPTEFELFDINQLIPAVPTQPVPPADFQLPEGFELPEGVEIPTQ